MPLPDNTSRGHFHSLLNTVLRVLRAIRTEERRLRLKDMRNDTEDDHLSWLFDARMRVFDGIVALSDAEDDYRRSNVGVLEALTALKIARDEARHATQGQMNATQAAEAFRQLVQIITSLVNVIARD